VVWRGLAGLHAFGHSNKLVAPKNTMAASNQPHPPPADSMARTKQAKRKAPEAVGPLSDDAPKQPRIQPDLDEDDDELGQEVAIPLPPPARC